LLYIADVEEQMTLHQTVLDP